MNALCVIGARGGSQGVPGKNVRPLLGKPVITWAIEKARQSGEFAHVVVSTDSMEIAEAARAAGAETPFMRPEDLSGPEVGKFQVWQHALDACEAHYREEVDIYVDIDCTNPLIEVEDIRAALAQFRASRGRGVDAVFTVSPSRRNPYFNMVEPDADGALRMSKSRGATVLARQAAPPVYDHVAGVYVLDPGFLRRASHLLEGHAEGYVVPEEKSFDIDSPFDFEVIEFLLTRRLGRTA